MILLSTAKKKDGEDCKKLSLIFNRTINPANIRILNPIAAIKSTKG